jgi:hypothetical protein
MGKEAGIIKVNKLKLKKMKTIFFAIAIALGATLLSCSKDEDKNADSNVNAIQIGGRTLTYHSCWLPVLSGGYLSSIHLIYNDSNSPTGLSKLYFTTLFAQCGGLPEVGINYNVRGSSFCRFNGTIFIILSDPNPRSYEGEIWYGTGNITFTVSEKNLENRTIHLVGTFDLIYTDTAGVEHTVTNSFDVTDTY